MKVQWAQFFARGAVFCAAVGISTTAAYAEDLTTELANSVIATSYLDEVACGLGCSDAAPCCGDDCCNDCCDSGCDCCDGGLCGKLFGCFERCDPDNCCSDGFLWGLFAPTDPCFNDFISPMTNPVFFEDPRTLSELRFIYLAQKVPVGTAGQNIGGGNVDLFMMQIRAALNDRVSIISTKNGYFTSSNPNIDDGWSDVNIGLKFNLMADVEAQRLFTAGVTYNLPVGSGRTLQGRGDGTLDIYGSYGEQVGCHAHWISTMGIALALDDAANSDLFYWSNHLDYHLGGGWYALAELNWYNYTRSGAGQLGTNGFEGGDLFNFGSTGVAGNDIVTGALGAKYKPYDDMEIGVAWEAPLTDRRDVLDNRFTFDLILRY